MTTSTSTAPATPATTVPPAVDRLLALVRGDAVVSDPFAPDARLDAVVPGWRLQRQGAEAVVGELRSWYRDPATIGELRRMTTPTGEIVELTIAWTENGVPHTSRQVHVLDLDASGRIVEDHVWCGGRWPADLLAQMAEAEDAG